MSDNGPTRAYTVLYVFVLLGLAASVSLMLGPGNDVRSLCRRLWVPVQDSFHKSSDAAASKAKTVHLAEGLSARVVDLWKPFRRKLVNGDLIHEDHPRDEVIQKIHASWIARFGAPKEHIRLGDDQGALWYPEIQLKGDTKKRAGFLFYVITDDFEESRYDPDNFSDTNNKEGTLVIRFDFLKTLAVFVEASSHAHGHSDKFSQLDGRYGYMTLDLAKDLRKSYRALKKLRLPAMDHKNHSDPQPAKAKPSHGSGHNSGHGSGHGSGH